MGRRSWIGAVQVNAQHIKSTHPHHPTPHPTHESGPNGGKKPKRLKGRRRHRGHPKGFIKAPGSTHRLTRQHQRGTGYTCPPLMLIEQMHTRLNINYYFQKKLLLYYNISASCIYKTLHSITKQKRQQQRRG